MAASRGSSRSFSTSLTAPNITTAAGCARTKVSGSWPRSTSPTGGISRSPCPAAAAARTLPMDRLGRSTFRSSSRRCGSRRRSPIRRAQSRSAPSTSSHSSRSPMRLLFTSPMTFRRTSGSRRPMPRPPSRIPRSMRPARRRCSGPCSIVAARKSGAARPRSTWRSARQSRCRCRSPASPPRAQAHSRRSRSRSRRSTRTTARSPPSAKWCSPAPTAGWWSPTSRRIAATSGSRAATSKVPRQSARVRPVPAPRRPMAASVRSMSNGISPISPGGSSPSIPRCSACQSIFPSGSTATDRACSSIRWSAIGRASPRG